MEKVKFGPWYERHKDKMREISRQRVFQGQDVGPIPPVVDEERRERALASFLEFTKYYPRRFRNPFCRDQLETIDECQDAVENGGKKRTVMPRGQGKTQIHMTLVEWAIYSGRWKNVKLVGSNIHAANRLMDGIKKSGELNDLLYEDFPEICHPIRSLGGAANKVRGQHVAGRRTQMRWGTREIVYPTVEGSQASGALLGVTGIFCSDLRGSFHTLPETGEVIRPQGVILDDVQNDGTAINPLRVEKLLEVINGTVLGMEGPDDALTILCPGTILAPDDVMSKLGDPDLYPDWSGKVYSLIYDFPDDIKLWEQYAVVRADCFRRGDKRATAATDFYLANREKMDKGAKVSWEHRYRAKKGEVSAIQCAMNLYFDNPEMFWKEYQNQPKVRDNLPEQLNRDDIVVRTNDMDRGKVRRRAKFLVSSIDVQGSLLYWSVTAFDEEFGASLVDYGSWPEQPRNYFSLEEAPIKFNQRYREQTVDGQIRAALDDCSRFLMNRIWERDGGGSLVRLDRIGVDTGYKDDVVCEWVRNSQYSAVLMPCRGLGIRAKQKPLHEYRKNDPRERYGFHWRQVPNDRLGVKILQVDVNFWKSFVATRLRLPKKDDGALTLFGRPGTDHRMFGDHCTAELCKPQIDELSGRRVEEWEERPGALRDNHLWDTLVTSFCIASYLGAQTVASQPKKTVSPNDRPTLRDLKNGTGTRR